MYDLSVLFVLFESKNTLMAFTDMLDDYNIPYEHHSFYVGVQSWIVYPLHNILYILKPGVRPIRIENVSSLDIRYLTEILHLHPSCLNEGRSIDVQE